MIIDNVILDSDGRASTTVHGFTFNHADDCGVHQAIKQWDTDWLNACDCYLSRVEITEINGQHFPIPDTAHVRWLQDELLRLRSRHARQLRSDRKYLLFATILGSCGWLYATARGIWGF